ncbi:MAG: IgGFc-binding protein [Myxococcota bacterium]|nr:IgGFc-binding protein [Myxococcota bacterium]
MQLIRRLDQTLIIPLIFGVTACNAASSSDDPPAPSNIAGARTGPVQTTGIQNQADMSPTPTALVDAQVLASVDAAINDRPQPDETEQSCAMPGETRCPAEGENFRQVCTANGQWTLEGCPNGRACRGEDCEPDPNACEGDAQRCSGTNAISACQNGAWGAAEPCPTGQRCTDGQCVGESCAVAAARNSYIGCDYLVVDLPNAAFDPDPGKGSTKDAPLGIVLGNPNRDQPVFVSVLGPNGQPASLIDETEVSSGGLFGERETIQSEVRDENNVVVSNGFQEATDLAVPGGGTAVLLLPRRMGPLRVSSQQKNAFRVQSSAPVAVYQFSPYCCNFSVSNDASLLLPTTALGNRYRFVGAPFTDENPVQPPLVAPPVISIAATNDETEVTVRLPEGAQIALPDGGDDITVVGSTYEATLDANDVLLLAGTTMNATNDDLTGADIEATGPIAVFSTHVCTSYPEKTAACDHLQEQLLPVSTWGGGFQLVPPRLRGGGGVLSREFTYWKIIGTDQATQLRFSVPFQQLQPQSPGFEGVPYCGDFLVDDRTAELDAGQHCEFGTQTAVQLQANGPIMVLGFMSGQNAVAGGLLPAGDPSVFVVPPDRQLRQDYVFMTPTTYASDFVTITTQPENEITLDGRPVGLDEAMPIPGSAYVVLHVPLSTDGVHRIAGQTPFGILVYAYDNYVSYAFTGGLNLSKR